VKSRKKSNYQKKKRRKKKRKRRNLEKNGSMLSRIKSQSQRTREILVLL